MNVHVMKHLTWDVVVLCHRASDSPIGILHCRRHSCCDLEELMQEISWYVMQVGHM
ncbi:hypothetical protein STAFG_0324 [Streptomyces afghaniensis 772]|uniref:Uncharacterized protein n=1 Tax=Streptomyces afghaniensis 772 TaxID=1283301 RepID=S4N3Y9_9ACTN|nr:hypothetical protein STAFG_0324 [Streptomyces afghaniensis 772]